MALGASFATDASSLPGAALGGAASLAWTPGRARVEIAGARFAQQDRTTGTSRAGATFTLTTAGARGCYALVRGAVELAPCAGLDVSFVSARGFGAATNYDASAQWTSAAGGALVRVPFASWGALRLQGEAAVPITCPRFVVQNEGPVHSPSLFGGRATAGVELLFL